MRVHLVDGTYELFRYFFALPSHTTATAGRSVRSGGVVGTLLGMLEEGATHVGVATDHVIESFRNDLWPTATRRGPASTPPSCIGQFPAGGGPARVRDHGLAAWSSTRPTTRWPPPRDMAAADDRVEQVVICTPDKDLAQCVGRQGRAARPPQGTQVLDADGVVEKFGVLPESIPDYLALVGDTRRRLPRPRRMGREVGGRRAAPATATSRPSPPTPATGT